MKTACITAFLMILIVACLNNYTRVLCPMRG